ncbi:hypothetical protein [uncultured Dokdonia sp.]|uniref:hypothetical protein n=1 Tax=uncultured Dokdonia sp. TaxID=575653 RepID=UPI00261D1342|nr:hypothetical protein [uncultured Dokdonia sp.]
MHTLNIKTIVLYVCLFLSSTLLFATDDDDDRPAKPGTEIVEDDCGFFCSIVEFFEDLFS